MPVIFFCYNVVHDGQMRKDFVAFTAEVTRIHASRYNRLCVKTFSFTILSNARVWLAKIFIRLPCRKRVRGRTLNYYSSPESAWRHSQFVFFFYCFPLLVSSSIFRIPHYLYNIFISTALTLRPRAFIPSRFARGGRHKRNSRWILSPAWKPAFPYNSRVMIICAHYTLRVHFDFGPKSETISSCTVICILLYSIHLFFRTVRQ